ncbi:conserved hypothetical protein [Candidatus Magnetomoraceae bacterium gMMP-15]
MKINKKAFTLLEILLAVSILGVIAFFAIGISQSVQNMGKLNETKSRMEQIAAKAKEYYRGHEDLPASPGTPANSVPVGASDLNMEQKFRLDAWGRYFEYHFKTKNDIDGNTILDILGLNVNGHFVAGALISYGPDQILDPNTISGASNENINSNSDDIVIPIDVSLQAVEIALKELKVLATKVKAIDALYEGVDNGGGNSNPDDIINMVTSPCEYARPTAFNASVGCPRISGLVNDPNCGTATLDNIDSFASPRYGCTMGTNAIEAIIAFYSLADPGYKNDPWGQEYLWGEGQSTYLSSNPHYHKFFSMGPNQIIDVAGGDDIIP